MKSDSARLVYGLMGVALIVGGTATLFLLAPLKLLCVSFLGSLDARESAASASVLASIACSEDKHCGQRQASRQVLVQCPVYFAVF